MRDVEHVDLPFPLLVKPAYEGSSKGIRFHSRVHDEESLRYEIDRLLGDYRTPVLVETFLPGREFTVGVLGNRVPYLLGIMEIIPSEGLVEDFVYSVVMKRECDERVRYRIPRDLPLSLLREIEYLALGAYSVLGCRDVTRIDVRLDRDGSPSFLEANPLPGIAPGYSDLVILAGLMGWSYERLIETILSHALERYGLFDVLDSDRLITMTQHLHRAE
jgi:D-alanine-D-alanine ligase